MDSDLKELILIPVASDSAVSGSSTCPKQQSLTICQKQIWDHELFKSHIHFSMSWDPVHEQHRLDRRQRAALARPIHTGNKLDFVPRMLTQPLVWSYEDRVARKSQTGDAHSYRSPGKNLFKDTEEFSPLIAGTHSPVLSIKSWLHHPGLLLYRCSSSLQCISIGFY